MWDSVILENTGQKMSLSGYFDILSWTQALTALY